MCKGFPIAIFDYGRVYLAKELNKAIAQPSKCMLFWEFRSLHPQYEILVQSKKNLFSRFSLFRSMHFGSHVGGISWGIWCSIYPFMPRFIPDDQVGQEAKLQKIKIKYDPGWWFQLLWKIWVRQLGWLFPRCGKIKVMSQSTNQMIPCYWNLVQTKL